MGDLDAKIGLSEATESCTGYFSIDTHNSKRDLFIKFAEIYYLKITNTFFKKRLRRH